MYFLKTFDIIDIQQTLQTLIIQQECRSENFKNSKMRSMGFEPTHPKDTAPSRQRVCHSATTAILVQLIFSELYQFYTIMKDKSSYQIHLLKTKKPPIFSLTYRYHALPFASFYGHPLKPSFANTLASSN